MDENICLCSQERIKSMSKQNPACEMYICSAEKRNIAKRYFIGRKTEEKLRG